MWLYLIAAVVILILLKKLIRLPTVGNYNQRYVFITGCDTGFGNMLAKRLDSLGFNVFAGCFTERGADELRKMSSARLKTVFIDVTKTESIVKAKEFVVKHLPADKGLWAIVNNAGVFGIVSLIELTTKEDYEKCISVNVYGTAEVTRIFLHLVRKAKGRVVNMSSMAGRLAIQLPTYAVSKYGVEAFSDCLRREVLKQGITVHIVEPAAFKTDLVDIDGLQKMVQARYDASSPEVKEFYGENFAKNIQKSSAKALDELSNKTYQVVDAYTNAVTARFPKYRYLVGDSSVLFGLFLWLPERISDPLLAGFTPKWRDSDVR